MAFINEMDFCTPVFTSRYIGHHHKPYVSKALLGTMMNNYKDM